jgi:exosortase D (VPLPA-CTERM-specific)
MREESVIIESPARGSVPAALASGWRWLLVACVAVVLYFPVLRLLVAQWWDDPNYSHGFLIPLFAAFVIWERRERLCRIAAKPALSGLVLLIASLALLFLGLLGAELFLARISLVGVILGLLLFLRGWPLVRALLFPLAALLLMIPLPTIVYNQMVFPLQLLASRLAAGTLQTCHIMPVLREGNILILPNATLEVADACSGIRSLMSLLAFTVMYGYLAEPKGWIRWLLCVAVAPVAVFSNAVRVIFASVGSRYWGEEVVEGWPHLLSGIVLFVVATLAMIGFHCLVRLLAGERAEKTADGGADPPPQCATTGSAGDSGLASGAARWWIAVAILALAALGTHTMRHGQNMPLRAPLQSIPRQIEGWQGADDPLDAKILAMTGVDDYLNRAYIRGADYMGLYIGYYRTQATGDTIHSPKNCLPGSGWQPVSSSTVELEAPGGRSVPVNSYVIQKGAERQVVLYWYQSQRRVMASEYRAKFYMIADALRWNRTDGALVRIAAPIAGDEMQTREQARRFAQQVLPQLNEILP